MVIRATRCEGLYTSMRNRSYLANSALDDRKLSPALLPMVAALPVRSLLSAMAGPLSKMPQVPSSKSASTLVSVTAWANDSVQLMAIQRLANST